MFNTKGQEVKVGGNFVDKSFEPGVIEARVYSATVVPTKAGDKKMLQFVLVGREQEGFEGWPIDKDDKEGPKFKGLSANVGASFYVTNDDADSSDVKVNEILAKMTGIADQLGKSYRDALDNINAQSIEEWVAKAHELIQHDYLWFFVAAEESEKTNSQGKPYLKLKLPKFKYASLDKSKLDTFDPENKWHYTKAKKKDPVDNFAPDAQNDYPDVF